MFLVIHENKDLKLVHISTHQDSIQPSQCSTQSYVGRASWAHKNYQKHGVSVANYQDGFQLALISSGLDASKWEDIHIDTDNYKADREMFLEDYEERGYTNVGSSKSNTIRSIGKASGFGSTTTWNVKDWNPRRHNFNRIFKKIQLILKEQGYNLSDELMNKVYFEIISTQPGTLNTKADALEYILKEVNYVF